MNYIDYDFIESYYYKNEDFLINKLQKPEGRIIFTQWLSDNFNPFNSSQNDFDWHSKVISIISQNATNFPSSNPQNEDLSIAKLIINSEPIPKKTDSLINKFFQSINDYRNKEINYEKIYINPIQLPFTTSILIKRKKMKNLIIDQIKSENTSNIRLLANLKPEEFKKAVLLKDNNNNTLVALAAVKGSYEILKIIAEVAPEEFKQALEIKNNLGMNPFFIAVLIGSEAIASLMINSTPKASTLINDHSPSGSTPSTTAASFDFLAILNKILTTNPDSAYTLNYDGFSSYDILKMRQFPGYKEITRKYKKSMLIHMNRELVKRHELSHAWNLNGMSYLICQKTKNIINKINLEGHYPPQWFRILGKDLLLFNKTYSKYYDKFDSELFQNVFDIGANLKCLTFEKKIERIQKGLPIIIGAGYNGHSIMLLIWGDQIAICNLGAGSKIHRPVKIRHFNPNLFSEKILKDLLIKYKYGTYSDFIKFFKELPINLSFCQTNLDKKLEGIAASLPQQKVGNCSFASLIAAFYTMKLIAEVKKIEQGFNYYKINGHFDEDSDDVYESLESDDEEINDAISQELSSDSSAEELIDSFEEEVPFQAGKPVDNEILKELKIKHEDWYHQWLNFTKISFLERNIIPLKKTPFKPDELLTLKALDQAKELRLDEICQAKLNQLTKIFYKAFVTEI